jgi:hypothetical protein
MAMPIMRLSDYLSQRSKIPKNVPFKINKVEIVDYLIKIDKDKDATERILKMEIEFRKKIKILSDNLPVKNSKLNDLWTNPFVLMAHTFDKGYSKVFEIENDILIGKVFSFIETSVGRMVEEVVLPVYSWAIVPSEMQSPYSVIDGEYITKLNANFVTLKSGPRCINDSMVRGMADEFVEHHLLWASEKNVKELDFTIGILYGTYKKSQKKDWHILDEVRKRMTKQGVQLIMSPDNQWCYIFVNKGVTVKLDVKIGIDLWRYIGGKPETYLEICIALVRACTKPTTIDDKITEHSISDLETIISTDILDEDFNVSILQRSQIEWLFLLVSHYCDELV